MPILFASDGMISSPLERLRMLATDAQSAAREASALQQIAVAGGKALDPDAVVETALDVLTEVTGADGGIAHVWDETGRIFRTSKHRNLDDEVLAEMREFRAGEGVCGRAAKQLRPIILRDLARSSRNIFRASVSAGHKSIAVVPLTAGHRALGVVRLISRKRGHFPEDSRPFLQAAGNAAGLALANARLFQQTDGQLRVKLSQLEMLSEISRELTSSLHSDELFAKIAKAAAELVGAERAVLLLASESDGVVRGVAGHGFTREQAASLVCRHQKAGEEELPGRGRFSICRNLKRAGATFREFSERFGVKSAECVPLIQANKAIGALAVIDAARKLSDDDVALLSAFAGQAVPVIQNGRLFENERTRSLQFASAREIARLGGMALDTPRVCQAICDVIKACLGYETVWIGMLEEGLSTVRTIAQNGLDPSTGLASPEMRLDDPNESAGCIRQAIRDKKPVVCVENHNGGTGPADCHPIMEHAGTGSLITLPMLTKDDVIGVIAVARQAREPFPRDEAAALELVAAEAAIAIRNSQLGKEAHQIYDRLSNIQKLSREIIASLDLNTVLNKACQNAVEALGLKIAWIGLIFEGSYRVEPVASYGVDASYLDGIAITYDDTPTGRGPTGTAIKTRRPVVAEDWTASPSVAPWRERAKDYGYRSSCAVPLIASGNVLGALNCYHENPRAFTDKMIEHLQALADQAAIAIQNARYHEAVSELAKLKDTILESVPDALLVVDRTGSLTMTNAAARRLSAAPEVAAGGAHYSSLFAPDHPASGIISSWIGDAGLPQPFLGWFGQPQETRRFLHVQSAPVAISGKPSLLVSVRDLTDQKHLEESLEFADKLSMLGNMAAQVAHEIGNPLGLMSSQLQRMLESGKSEPLQLRGLLRHVDRMASLVENLSHLGRKTPLRKEPVHMPDVVREVLSLTRFDKRFLNTQVQEELHQDVPPVSVDRGKIVQVLLNLLLNAASATTENGKIRILCRAASPVVFSGTRKIGGEYVLVAVSDTGRGMSPEVLARIWEPFYTTRPVGVGGGLGLPVSLAIIDQHRGFMEARSAAGRGSTFSVWLPVKGWPDCWKVTDGCTDEIRFACPVFRDQICHRCWSNRGAVCREKGWPNPFLVKPPALIEEV